MLTICCPITDSKVGVYDGTLCIDIIGVSLSLGLTKERLGNAAFLSSAEQSNRKTPSSRIGSKTILPELTSDVIVFPSYPAILDTTTPILNLLLGLFFLHIELTLGTTRQLFEKIPQ